MFICANSYRPLLSERVHSPRPSSIFNSEPSKNIFNDEPLSAARRRAERVITEDAFFDVRGARVPKSSVGETIREFDEEVKFIYCHCCCYVPHAIIKRFFFFCV